MPFPGILLLGATGRIGQVLQRCWPGTGMADRTLWQARPGSLPGSWPGSWPVAAGGARLNWTEIDILEERDALARAAQGRDVILCLAGVVPGRDHGRGAELGRNVLLAEAAIRAGSEAGARVILTSSAAIYGNRAGLFDENMAPAPVSEYGRAKAEMEAAGAELGQRLGVEVCSLRIGNIAGLDAILGGWAPGFRLDRFADGRTPRRSYIGVRTLARVLAELCAAPALPHALNVAAPGAVEMGALLDAADLGWTARPAPDSAIADVQLDVTALQRILAVGEARPETLVAEWRGLAQG